MDTTHRTLTARRLLATALLSMLALTACTDDAARTRPPSATDTPSASDGTASPAPSETPAPSATPSPGDVVSDGGALFDGGPIVAADGLALVFVDGWSMRAMAGDRPQARVDFEPVDTEFVAVTGPQLAGLAGSHPQLVEVVIGRMVDGATNVTCDGDGCLVGTEADGYRLDLEQLATIAASADVDGYGEVYDAWSVGPLLHVAAVDVGDAQSLTVRHDGSQLDLPLAATQTGEFDDGEATDLADPVAVGFAEDLHLVAFGLGNLFTPTPQWQQVADAPYLVPLAVSAPLPVDEAGDVDRLPLMGAVGNARTAADGLTYGQLTYLTSPTTGCGVGVVCAPTGDFPATVTVAASETLAVCGADGGETTAAVVTDATVQMDLVGPIHQLGMWNGAAPDDFGKRTSGFFSGLPALAPADTTMRQITVTVLQAGGLAYDMVGSNWQVGVDEGADAPFDAAAAVAATGVWSTDC